MSGSVPDSWSKREFPVLSVCYRWFDAHPERGDVRFHEVLAELDPTNADEDGWGRALDRLERAGYVDALRVNLPYPFAVLRLTERGLRAVGAWPSDADPLQALVGLLSAQADSVEAKEPEKAGRLRAVADAVGRAALDVGTDFAAKFAARAAGLP